MRICLVVICTTSLLSACATVQDPELKPDIPEKWRNVTTQNPSKNSAPVAWWKALNDPLLNQSVILALKQNLSLAQASELLIAARAMSQATLSNEYPRIGFMAGPDNLARPLPEATGTEVASNSESSFRTTGAYIAGFDLTWELPLFGRASGQHKITQAGIHAVEADLRATRISICAEVVRVYGELRAAQDRMRVLNSIIVRYQALNTLASHAQQAGLISESDLDSPRKSLAELQTTFLSARVQRESALQRLAVLCGLSVPLREWMSQKEAEWKFAHSQIPLPAIPVELIRHRPDIQHAEASVLQASGEAGVARADLYPRLAIEGALMVAGNLAGASRATQTIAMLAPSIHMPLVDWGLARNVVNARDAKLREAVLAYREAVLLAIEETEDALANFNASDERLSREGKDVELSRNASARAQSAFDEGYLSRPEMLRRQIRTLECELRQIEAQAGWITAFAAFSKAQAIIADDHADDKL